MPIDIETFESSSSDRLRKEGETNTDRVMHFLTSHPDKAFTQSEIRDGTGVEAGSVSAVLWRLEEGGAVRNKGNYWALGEDKAIEAYANLSDDE